MFILAHPALVSAQDESDSVNLNSENKTSQLGVEISDLQTCSMAWSDEWRPIGDLIELVIEVTDLIFQ